MSNMLDLNNLFQYGPHKPLGFISIARPLPVDQPTGISLRKRRKWFADEDADENADESDNGDNDNEDGDASSDLPDFSSLPDTVQAEFKKLREQNAKLRKRAQSAESTAERERREAREREQARLAEQGQFKQLAESRASQISELEPYKDRAQALEQRITESNNKRIERVPENMRTLIPSGLPAESLSDWLDTNFELLTRKPAPSTDAGAGAGTGGAAITLTAEQRDIAKKAGMTEEQYRDMLARMGPQQ